MRAIVDTNVILVANGAHDDVTDECRDACAEMLLALTRGGRVLIDDANEIVDEYLHKSEPHKGQRLGDAFLKWLLNNQGNRNRVERVPLTRTAGGSYAEVDALEVPLTLDPSDLKFVAVAAAANQSTPILQASDSKWLDWWPELSMVGIEVKFLCPDDIARFHRRKYPKRVPPQLP